MIVWLVAGAAGLALALLSYRPSTRSSTILWVSFVLRATAWITALALLLDAPIGRNRRPSPVFAIDASSSMARGRDPSTFRSAAQVARPPGTDVMWLFGDSVRRASSVPDAPDDSRSALRPVVERAAVEGRPVALFTDGEIDDPEFADELPAGSSVILHRPTELPDRALADMRGQPAAAVGDTLELQLQIVGAGAQEGAGELRFLLDDRLLGVYPLDRTEAGEQNVTAQVVVQGAEGERVLRAVIAGTPDAEPRNDTIAVPLLVSRVARASFVSTNPDNDARFALAALRASLQLPVRGFWRVAPGQWRTDGTLSPVAEGEVRDAVREAPLVVIHGDTAYFGDPRAAARGSLVLHHTTGVASGDWFATEAPISPISSSLSTAPWDSLPPVTPVGPEPRGEPVALLAQLGRRGGHRPLVVLSDGPRRVVTIAATGFWRWKFRGGAGSAVYDALYGSIFDWAAAARPDSRPAVPASVAVREGERIVWRRGGADSVVVVALARVGGAGGVDSVTLHFAAGEMMTTSGPVPAGVYQARMSGSSALLVVNPTRELLPRAATLREGPVGGGGGVGSSLGLRTSGIPFAVIVLALCAEWLLRRRRGDR
jgi:hypothetical protein